MDLGAALNTGEINHFRAGINVPVHEVEAANTCKAQPVSVCMAPQMHGFGHADVWGILQLPGNKADTVPCERLRIDYLFFLVLLKFKWVKMD